MDYAEEVVEQLQYDQTDRQEEGLCFPKSKITMISKIENFVIFWYPNNKHLIWTLETNNVLRIVPFCPSLISALNFFPVYIL